MRAGRAPAPAVLQKPFVYQRIADGSDGNAGADIIGEEQDDLPQQRGVCDLLLPPALFPLQNIANHDGGVNAIQKRQRLFLLQTDVGDARHSAEAHIGVEDLAQCIAFAVPVERLLAKPAEGALCFTNLKTVKIEELAKGERQHFDFYASPGEIRGILRGKKESV